MSYEKEGEFLPNETTQNTTVTEEALADDKQEYQVLLGLGTLGTVGGFIYVAQTGGGFWRYVGYGLILGHMLGTGTGLLINAIKK